MKKKTVEDGIFSESTFSGGKLFNLQKGYEVKLDIAWEIFSRKRFLDREVFKLVEEYMPMSITFNKYLFISLILSYHHIKRKKDAQKGNKK